MTSNQIRKTVLSALQEIQEMSGREWVSLSDSSKPIGALSGFDSHNGVEFTCAIEEELECNISDDENLCVEDLPNGRRRARSITEIVNVISKLAETNP